MRATDQMLAKIAAEIEQQQAFQDKLLEDAERENRDLTDNDLELFRRSRDEIAKQQKLAGPIQESRRISTENQTMLAELARFTNETRNDKPAQFEYRSAGQWVSDYVSAALGSTSAKERLDLYTRAAAHQTTADNPGLLPDQILGPIINFVDESRPLIGFFGARQLPQGSWSRPRITQHTQVGDQTAEKAELVSRKMIIDKLPVTAKTKGGYVNISRQDIDWTQPAIMDIVLGDLAGQYAIETENDFADALMAAATVETPIPTGPASAAAVSAALWTAVGNVYTATKGVGRLFQAVSPDMLGMLGPLFAPVNPTNSQSPGFNAGDIGSGTVGQISGVPVIVSAGLNTGSWLVGTTAAAEVYEDRIGPLSVIEPSVLGTQVAYAGFFANVVLVPTALRKIAKTP